MELSNLLDTTREKRAAALAAAEVILVKAATEQRALTPEEQKASDDHIAESDKLGVEEARLVKLISEKAAMAQPQGRRSAPVAPVAIVEPEARKAAPRIVSHATPKAFRAADGQTAVERAYAAGQWFLATIGRNDRSAQWCADNGIETRAMGTTTNTLGGFLVPEVLESTIIALREERGVARREVNVMPMSSDVVIVPRRSSGVTAYYVAENAEITASDAGWDSVSLAARKLAVLCRMSSEISEDAVVSLADYIATEVAYAFADAEDKALFLGDGTSTYGGIVGLKSALQAGSKYEAIAGNTAFSTLDFLDFENMVGKLPLYALANAKWYISRPGFAASMLRLLDAAGGNTSAMLSAGAALSFMGYPVVLSQVLNNTLTAQTSTDGLLYFGDLRQSAMMGTRRGVSIDVDSSRYFELDQLAIRGTQRFDLNVHERGTASVAGSIIGLSTPAS
jgi:HK97 family phage major capsid protein